VRSLRTTNTHGRISKAVLTSQLEEVNDTHTTPTRRASMASSCLRLKQLMAVQMSGLHLREADIDTAIDTLPRDMPEQVTAQLLTPAIAKAATKCCPKLISDVMTLSELSIHSLDQIINIHTHCVMPASALKSMHINAQHQKVTSKHQAALNRFTLFLHKASIAAIEQAATESKKITYGCDSNHIKTDLPSTMRQPSADIILLLRDVAIRNREPPALIALNRLLEQHEQEQTSACTHRGHHMNINVAGKKRKSDIDTSHRHADVRVRLGGTLQSLACDHVDHNTYSRTDTCSVEQTAKSIYNTLPKGKQRLHGVNDAWRDVRLKLMSAVVGEQDDITDILHIRQTTEIIHDTTEKGTPSKRHNSKLVYNGPTLLPLRGQ